MTIKQKLAKGEMLDSIRGLKEIYKYLSEQLKKQDGILNQDDILECSEIASALLSDLAENAAVLQNAIDQNEMDNLDYIEEEEGEIDE